MKISEHPFTMPLISALVALSIGLVMSSFEYLTGGILVSAVLPSCIWGYLAAQTIEVPNQQDEIDARDAASQATHAELGRLYCSEFSVQHTQLNDLRMLVNDGTQRLHGAFVAIHEFMNCLMFKKEPWTNFTPIKPSAVKPSVSNRLQIPPQDLRPTICVVILC